MSATAFQRMRREQAKKEEKENKESKSKTAPKKVVKNNDAE